MRVRKPARFLRRGGLRALLVIAVALVYLFRWCASSP